MEDDGLQVARIALKRSLELFPEEARQLHSDAQKRLDKLFPGQDEIEIYHSSASPWNTFKARGGFDELRSFTYDRKVAEKFISEDLGGSGWLYKVKVPKSWIGVVVDYSDSNIRDYAYQKEVLNTTKIPLRAIFEAKQVRGKKK